MNARLAAGSAAPTSMWTLGRESPATLQSVYGLDIGTDVTALVGCELESVDLTQHQVVLRLDSLNGILLSVESDFAITVSDGVALRFDLPPKAAQLLADRLGVKIVDARVASPGTLTLRWADGAILEVFDSNEHYESYQIQMGERLVVV